MTAWDRTQWEVTVLSAGLPPGPVKTALALAVHADDGGRAAPGERQLAEISRQSRSAVYYHLRRLRAAGLVEREDGRDRGHSAVVYWLVVPA